MNYNRKKNKTYAAKDLHIEYSNVSEHCGGSTS